MTIAKVERLASHPKIETVANSLSSAFDLATGLEYWWKAETRDELVRIIAGKIPELNNYYLKHMVRSLAYVHRLDDIPCKSTYYNMSKHNDEAIDLFEKAEVTPIMVIEDLRAHNDLSYVNRYFLPDDDMMLELAICQTWSVFVKILNGELPVYDLKELSNFGALEEIYWCEWSERSEHSCGGIAHAPSGAYAKLKGKLKPDTSVELPLQFPHDDAKAKWFLRPMKALLKSRIIAKSPLKNANGIHALEKSMNAFKAKGHKT